jgi:ComF family protein
MNKAFYAILVYIQAMLDIVFPEYCISCKKRGLLLCLPCVEILRKVDRPTDRYIHALFDYRDPVVKKAIWHLKYHNKKILGEILGNKLYEEFLEELSEIYAISGGTPIHVIPVPLSKEKYRKRGYNQAESIARAFCNNAPFLVLDTILVYKKINTTAQATIHNRSSRLKNIHNAFAIQDKYTPPSRTVIVIDDVTTTGGTFKEIKHVLKDIGVKKIICFAVAH